MLPAICGLDDYFFARFFPRNKIFLSIYSNQKVTSRIRKGINIFVFCLIGKLSYPVVINLFSSRQVMNTSFDPLKYELIYPEGYLVAEAEKEKAKEKDGGKTVKGKKEESWRF